MTIPLTVLENREGLRTGIDLNEAEALIEQPDGWVQVVTGSDTYTVKASFDDLREEWLRIRRALTAD